MKKLLGVLLVSFLAVFLMTGSSIAFPFVSSGWVNPDFVAFNETTLEGTARYSFYIETPDVYVNYAEIEFENDIFDLSVFTAANVNVVSPGDWTEATYADATSYKWALSAGGTSVSTLNDPLVIDVTYKLLSLEMKTHVFGTGWEWDEGQPFANSYFLSQATLSPLTTGYSYGSTAPVPEPATMLLLGSGLIGLAGVGRKKFFNKS
jgi:hypothetical protein